MKLDRNLRRTVLVAALAAAAGACADTPSGVDAGATLALSFTELRALDPATEGSYEVWAVDAKGVAHSLGRFDPPADGRVDLRLPIASPSRLEVTVEPPGDTDAIPSRQVLLCGEVGRGGARLTTEDCVTAGFPLNDAPGAHSLFTSSNNVKMGYPSHENAGLWLFNLNPARNRHRSREVMLTPLRAGWLYEGWIVLRHGQPDAVWISYGKFRPDQLQLLTSRDDTGSGPFSGDEDFRNGGIEDVPGDEWTSNPFGLAVPGGLDLPLQLDAVDAATGRAVWTHVITIEPAWNEDEPLVGGRPFLLRPYRNPIGAGGPGVPREIGFVGGMPAATVQVRP